ncbi:retrograde regulation protein 2 [Capronia epimyces CBS 606.96]|uniref:Retrograde regulation protein 2 n=1 Tax=Capronia epimyces CBS 606.96 TaxID=1182542 RepID=W9XCI9_9EURO|nr:retrograde regulation protein 2 [Capronia epimyces CBS 606.96]EXJ77913.1 retrograde regulation protein 2 [Capronia epimyces CBS 606.96]
MKHQRPAKHGYLIGVVDMGSNGIRFSISDLSPPTTRILPTLYFDRVGISLYEAQYDPETGEKIPIPRHVIRDVTEEFRHFTHVCKEFGVQKDRIRVVATEATRTMINSKEFRDHIRAKTGLVVKMLSKEEEGHVGAMGIVSSFSEVRGLVMDLGGGSAQITWIISTNGMVRTSPKVAISFPYGAAAITKRLEECANAKDPDRAKEEFRQEIADNFRKAFDDLEIPQELKDRAEEEGGCHLYLSGGGFRGWGYLLLNQSQNHGHHYPISIINGFKVYKDDLTDTERLKEVARTAEKIFRVSDRRRYQVPAVAFLLNVVANTLPIGISVARFCQGGVREGLLFRDLPPSVRALDPIAVASAPFAPHSAAHFKTLLLNALPSPSHGQSVPASLTHHVIEGLANLSFHHASLSKETASVAALYTTTTGVLTSAHGLSHSSRARIALMLENRYDGELPPREEILKSRLSDLLSPEEIWWGNYTGTLMWLIGQFYPTGKVGPQPQVWLTARFVNNLGKKGRKKGVELTISVPRSIGGSSDAADSPGEDDGPLIGRRRMQKYAKRVAKVGKKKNWVGGGDGEGDGDGWGMKVQVLVAENLSL